MITFFSRGKRKLSSVKSSNTSRKHNMVKHENILGHKITMVNHLKIWCLINHIRIDMKEMTADFQ